MRKRTRSAGVCLLSCFLIGALAERAGATYHTFKLAQVYSNPSGTVQFIELHESLGASGQNLVSEAPDIRSGANRFVFPSDLPNGNTAGAFFLLGTAGYNAISGAPKADFVIPSGFFNPAGDTLQYGSTGPDGVVDTSTFGAVPSSASQALFRQGTSGNTFTTGQAVANTFSNGTGFAVPEPASLGVLALAAAGLTGRPGRRRA